MKQHGMTRCDVRTGCASNSRQTEGGHLQERGGGRSTRLSRAAAELELGVGSGGADRAWDSSDLKGEGFGKGGGGMWGSHYLWSLTFFSRLPKSNLSDLNSQSSSLPLTCLPTSAQAPWV